MVLSPSALAMPSATATAPAPAPGHAPSATSRTKNFAKSVINIMLFQTGCILVCMLSIYGAACLAAPATGHGAGTWGSGKGLLEPGTTATYDLVNTVLLGEPDNIGAGNDVGYQITAKARISTMWAEPAQPLHRLISVLLMEPKLHIKSRKAPAPEGFVEHSSELDSMENNEFFLEWLNGQVKSMHVVEKEPLAIVNIKKGIASLLQFRLLDTTVSEEDASGVCNTKYYSIDPQTIRKQKDNCTSAKGVAYLEQTEKVLGVTVQSTRNTLYILSNDISAIKSIESEETHTMRANLRPEAGSEVLTKMTLTFAENTETVIPLKVDNLKEALNAVQKIVGKNLVEQTLLTHRESLGCFEQTCPSLSKLVKEKYDALTAANLGTIRSASAFLRLLPAAREASKDEFSKVLKSSKNKDILPQLCDLAGAAQTIEAHRAVKKAIQLDSEVDLDNAERYLWALSMGSHPVPEVVKDLLKLSRNSDGGPKIKETLLLTVASLARRVRQKGSNQELVDDVKKHITNGLSSCSKDEDPCIMRHLRALKNFADPSTVPDLLNVTVKGTRTARVGAMKALLSLPKESRDENVIQAARRIYFELDRRFDSSSRTLAIDIVLESDPQPKLVRELILSLKKKDRNDEVKQYLLQRIQQISDRDQKFGQLVSSILREEGSSVNNYHVLTQRGLSTAFTRSFLSGSEANGSLVTVQEISGGLLKRGIVDVSLETPHAKQSIFTLGLFAGGLNSFVSSDDSSDGPEAEEEKTEPAEETIAGMEVTLLGTQIRPFVFFNGQGELMGHLWTGTASERTPAFQNIALLQDHKQFLPLQTGAIVDLSLIGASSFELAGEVQISLWSRNGQSLVEKKAGISVTGLMRVDTAFVRNQIEFNVATEPTLSLTSNIDFSSNVALCMQLKQPDTILKHHVYKVERIPGSKHKLRKSRYQVFRYPGCTYALNRKNNEMCNVIFQEQ